MLSNATATPCGKASMRCVSTHVRSSRRRAGRGRRQRSNEELRGRNKPTSTASSNEENPSMDYVTQVSPDVTEPSDAAISQYPTSKTATDSALSSVKSEVTRFNADGIPLELRPKKIWRAFGADPASKTIPSPKKATLKPKKSAPANILTELDFLFVDSNKEKD